MAYDMSSLPTTTGYSMPTTMAYSMPTSYGTGSYGMDSTSMLMMMMMGMMGGLLTGMSNQHSYACLLYTSQSPRDQRGSRMPSSA